MLYEWFVKPIIERTGYNVFNTAAYAVLLLASVFIVARLLEKMRIRTDKELWKSVTPFVVFAGVLRALQDHGFFSSLGVLQYLFVTPLIYFTVFLLAFSSILVSKKTGKKFAFFLGWFLVLVFSTQIIAMTSDVVPFVLVVFLAVLVFSFSYFLVKSFNSSLLDSLENKSTLFGQILDSCSSTIAIIIVGGFSEQHVLPNALFSFIPFYFFIPLKVTITLLALYAIDKEIKTKSTAWVLKLAVFAVGAGPGIRNTLTMMMS